MRIGICQKVALLEILTNSLLNRLSDLQPTGSRDTKNELSKENYRPISISPNISKVYKRCLYDQISKYFEIRFSKLQSGFRKGYSAKHCLLAMIEKRKTAFDNGGVFAALLTDLSKVCDCIPHDLIIDKLVAYDFDTNALKLIHNIYLTGSKE